MRSYYIHVHIVANTIFDASIVIRQKLNLSQFFASTCTVFDRTPIDQLARYGHGLVVANNYPSSIN